jgi:hypothetical protein
MSHLGRRDECRSCPRTTRDEQKAPADNAELRTELQKEFWILTSDVVQSPGNALHDGLNGILDKGRFDIYVERLCRRYYKGPYGRPSLALGMYFRER